MVGYFHGTGIEIWAGFGPIGSTEKKGGKMLNFHKKRCSVRIKKLHKMKLTRFFFLKKLNLFFYFIKKHFQLCLAPHRGTYLQ